MPGLTERRKEVRLPLKLHADIYQINGATHHLKGSTKDISLHGVQIFSDIPVKIESNVSLSFSNSSFGELYLHGIVKWCLGSENSFLAGIQLSEKNTLEISFERLFYLLQENVQIKVDDGIYFSTDINEINNFIYSLIYKGYFFYLCNNFIKNQINTLIYKTDLSHFYFKKYLQLLDKPLFENDQSRLDHIETTLRTSKKFLSHHSELISNITSQDNADICAQETREIDFNHYFHIRLNYFFDQVRHLDFNIKKGFSYSFNDVPLFYADIHKFTYGLDFLILYCFQFLLFQEASSLHIETFAKNNYLYLIFNNDGPKILKPSKIFLSFNSSIQLFNYSTRDRKHLAWLQFILSFFQSHGGSISIESEAGNNRLTLFLSI